MERMELVLGPGQPGLLVKMLRDTRGCRTKYMTRMKIEDEEITEPLDGSISDSNKPQLPSPGDIRRMFGNDKIDCEPEYTTAMDPDWSRVSPTTTPDMENKIRENETTKVLFQKYRLIEEKRKQFKSHRQCAKSKSKSVSEGVKRNTPKQKEKRNNNDIFLKLKNNGSGVCQKSDLLPTTSVPLNRPVSQENNLLSSNNNIIQENRENNITFKPYILNRQSYSTAINVLQRMDSSHWLIIDNLYNDIKRENGTNFEHLNSLVSKIVQEIYGIDCEFILSTIHPDSVQRIVNLGKLMLNIYHHAVFGSEKNSKELSAGTRDKNFTQKSIEVFTTFSPCKYQSTTMTSKMHRDLLSTRTNPRCIACLFKNKANEKNTTSDRGKIWNRNNQIKKSNIKSKLKSNVSGNKSNKRIKQSDEAINQVGVIVDNKSKADINNDSDENYLKSRLNMSLDVQIFSDEFLQAVSDIAVFNSREPTEEVTCEEVYEAATSEQDTFVSETKVTSSATCLKQPFKSCSKEVLECFDQVVGGGDNNDGNVLSKSEPTEANWNGLQPTEKCQANGYLTMSENLIIINNLLENTLLHENDDTSKSAEELNDDTENESYHDCDNSFMAVNTPEDFDKSSRTKAKNKCYKKPRWMQPTNDCILHKTSVRAFMTLMLGLITVFFWRGSFANKPNYHQPSLKDNIKQVLRTFLLGMNYKYVQNC